MRGRYAAQRARLLPTAARMLRPTPLGILDTPIDQGDTVAEINRDNSRDNSKTYQIRCRCTTDTV